MKRPLKLPNYACEFLKTHDARHAERVLRAFHHWLGDRNIRDLTRRDFDDFIENPRIAARTRNDYRYKLRRYIDWLFAKGLLTFNAAWLRVRRETLADSAEAFLSTIEPTRRPGTINVYRTSLRSLHEQLGFAGVTVEAVQRTHVEGWLRKMFDAQLAPASRVNIIVAARVYLRWLDERGQLDVGADELIRTSDLPKLPNYLPRPLPPNADQELQRRLEASANPLHQALLLMRKTGLRVGELSTLTWQCIREDNNGRSFLKVPLGKMHNERLVPLDLDTLALAKRIQAHGRAGRELLIETVRGKRTRHWHYSEALAEAAAGLELPEKMTSHRLRHTYATSLMNAGMSLMGVMKLLGHRDYRMTLRYTEITLETVGDEYQAALTKMEKRYRIALEETPTVELDPDGALEDIQRWLKKRGADNPELQRRADLLADRLRKIRQEVRALGT